MKFFIFILYIGHIVGCLWHLIAYTNTTEETWLKKFEFSEKATHI